MDDLLSPKSSTRKTISSISHYHFLKTVGQGQFGKVKLAIHQITKDKVAVKIIEKQKLDEVTLKMVYREVSIMKLLNHPHIIRLFEVIDTEQYLFLVMEYASGGEVMDLIVAHGRLQEKDARRFFRQIVAALDYCHSLHVIHRDLKAENLLLDSKMNIKVIDFGLSNCFVPGSYMKTFCGSPTYTAPELIQRKKYEGPEVDVWSLGVVLFVLVCGYLPFDGQSFQELFQKIIAGYYTVPDWVSPECRDLISRMLVVNPAQRATLDQVREHPWIRVNGQPVPKADVSPMNRPLMIDDIDQSVLEEVVKAGFDREQAIQAILDRTYDDAAAIYFLLVDKKEKNSLQRKREQAQIDGVIINDPYSKPSTPELPQPSASSTAAATNANTPFGTNDGMAALLPSSAAGAGTPLNSIDERFEVSPSSQSPRESSKLTRVHSTGHFSKRIKKYSTRVEELRQSRQRHFSDRPQRQIQRISRTRHRRTGSHDDNPDVIPESTPTTSSRTSRSTSPTKSPRSPAVVSPKSSHGGTSHDSPEHSEHYSNYETLSSGNVSPNTGASSKRNTVDDETTLSNVIPHKSPRTVINKSEDVAGKISLNTMGDVRHVATASPIVRSKRANSESGNDFVQSPLCKITMTPSPVSGSRKLYPMKGSTSGGNQTFSVQRRKQVTLSSNKYHRRYRSHDEKDTENRKEGERSGNVKHKTSQRPTETPAASYLTADKYLSPLYIKHRKSPDAKFPPSTQNPSPTSAPSKEQLNSAGQLSPLTKVASLTPTSPPNERKENSISSEVSFVSSQPTKCDSSLPQTPPPPPTTTTTTTTPTPTPTNQSNTVTNPTRSSTTTLIAVNTPPSNITNTSATNVTNTTNNNNIPGIKKQQQKSDLEEDWVILSPDDISKQCEHKKGKMNLLEGIKAKFGKLLKKKKPRRARFPLNEAATSHRSPETILNKLKHVLKEKKIPFLETGPFCLMCEAKSVIFEAEICQLPFINLNAVRFRRIRGNAWEYKAICKEILDDLDLKEQFSLKNVAKSASSVVRTKENEDKEKSPPSTEMPHNTNRTSNTEKN